eukprot:c3029_g1_i1.p1 GENE.c3029_g1_i1~~c3029_g1_i1.p1  ORF type:complete len:189 (-),score=35.79 c3029_g1_i1:52-585(-)
MPAYHSTIEEEGAVVVCKTALLPLKTTVRGPAPPADAEKEDIIDVALFTFKANSLQKNFEFKSHGDRTLVYATLFISQCLARIFKLKPSSKAEGKKILFALAMEEFSKPGEAAFPVSAFFEAPKNKDEGETWRLYMKQMREEITNRLLDRVFEGDTINKFWVHQFAKRKFMNKSLGE